MWWCSWVCVMCAGLVCWCTSFPTSNTSRDFIIGTMACRWKSVADFGFNSFTTVTALFVVLSTHKHTHIPLSTRHTHYTRQTQTQTQTQVRTLLSRVVYPISCLQNFHTHQGELWQTTNTTRCELTTICMDTTPTHTTHHTPHAHTPHTTHSTPVM